MTMGIIIFIVVNILFYFIGYARGVDRERKRQETMDKLAEVFRIMEKRKIEHNPE